MICMFAASGHLYPQGWGWGGGGLKGGERREREREMGREIVESLYLSHYDPREHLVNKFLCWENRVIYIR